MQRIFVFSLAKSDWSQQSYIRSHWSHLPSVLLVQVYHIPQKRLERALVGFKLDLRPARVLGEVGGVAGRSLNLWPKKVSVSPSSVQIFGLRFLPLLTSFTGHHCPRARSRLHKYLMQKSTERHHHFLAAVAGLLISGKPNFHNETTHFRDVAWHLEISQVDWIYRAFPAKGLWIQQTKHPGNVVAVM